MRIGLLGIGLAAYWSQFEGLETRLLSYLDRVEGMIQSPQRSITNFGLVDSHEKALSAGHACRQHDIDILLIYITTYALSANILPVVQRAKVPIILLNLQPTLAIDYNKVHCMKDRTEMTGEWLAYCNSCPVPEIANLMRRLNLSFHQVTGTLEEGDPAWLELEEWLAAAQVKETLSHSRLALMGHYYSGMLDIATDLAQVSGRFGVYIDMVEVDTLSALRRAVRPDEVASKIGEFSEFFAIDSDCSEAELMRAATTAVALERLVCDGAIDMLAYYYLGSGVPENENTMSSIILGTSLLTGRGIPIAGEYEVKNVIAMKILDALGAGGSFTEFYALDFKEDLVLMGHDGPGHPGIAQDKVRVRPLNVYHGKVGDGLSVEMAVQHGPVTLLSIVEDSDIGFSFLIAEGESVAGPILEIGNTNSRYRFPLGARGFVEAWNAHGPAHHCAVAIGHRGRQLQRIAALLGISFQQIC